jgi:phosphonate transport system substrate-binding protein
VAEQVGAVTGRGARLVVGQNYDELLGGTVDVAFLCGWPYVRLVAQNPGQIELLAAPVLSGPRYQGKPVYFSDVIVRANSPLERFEDLRGRSWSFNEPTSYSGYLATLYHLARMGERGPFFGRSVAAGSHQESIRKVVSGEVDASAIDSQVLELELRRQPELRPALRVIESFGPAAIQPVVASARLDPGLRRDIRSAIDAVSGEPLRGCLFESFVTVDDSAYDGIRVAEQQVKAARLTLRQAG